MAGTANLGSGNFIAFKGHGFTLDTYNRFFRQGLINDAQRVLFDQLLFTEVSTIDSKAISSFIDDHDNSTEGYCFLNDTHNAQIISKLLVDIPANFSNRRQRASLTTPQELALYGQAIESFLELLIVAILASGGDGGDCVDLVNATIANHGARKRSIFMDASQRRIAGSHEDVPSFDMRPLPRCLSSMVAMYLINVVPFVKEQENMVFRPGNYLFSSGDGRLPWSEERFEGILLRESEERLGIALGFRDFKEVSVLATGIEEKRKTLQ
jgi:hypothetical protein